MNDIRNRIESLCNDNLVRGFAAMDAGDYARYDMELAAFKFHLQILQGLQEMEQSTSLVD